MPDPKGAALEPEDVRTAARRIAGRVHRTPLLRSATLDRALGHDIVFKAEHAQRVGAFKSRGALNALLALEARGVRPERVVAFSSGNHAQAVAWACRSLGIPCRVVMPGFASPIKRRATEAYGAEVVLTGDRPSAERAASRAVDDEGFYLLPPYDDDDVICGQGTACLEALEDGAAPDAVFVPCGGGGLLSGTHLASLSVARPPAVFGVEPVDANDAARSYREGTLCRFEQAPPTIADGVRTLGLSERTFAYARRTAGILEVEEDAIVYWTQWLTHLLKATVEPTAALAMAGACRWLADRESRREVLVVLSGGNLSVETRSIVWAHDRLDTPPSLTH